MAKNTAKKGFGKRMLAVVLSLIMMTSLFNISALAATGDYWNPGGFFPGGIWNPGGGYVLDEQYFDEDRAFGWDTYTEGTSLLDENNQDVYDMITVTVGDDTLARGRLSRTVDNGDVVENGVTISNIPAGFYISAYKIVCEKYACYTDQAGNATDETVSLDAGKGGYSLSISKADLGHANVNATRYWILIELSAYEEEKETIVTYPYSVLYNYGELADRLAGEAATVDSNTYAMNAFATILSPAAAAAADALGYRFLNWEVESVEGSFAVTNGVVGTAVDPDDTLTITGETTLKAVWEKIPAYDLTVNYVDEAGEPLADQIVENDLREGTEYATEQKEIEGYTFLEIRGDDDTGIMDEDKTVTYVYSKIPAQYTLTVNYVDESGAALADSATETYTEGAAYSTAAAAIEGYTFKEVTGDAAEGIMDGNKEVTCVYTQDAPPAPVEPQPEPEPEPEPQPEPDPDPGILVPPRYTVRYRYTEPIPAGAPGVPASASYRSGALVFVADEPYVEGYTFSGWSTGDADVMGSSFEMPRNTVLFLGSWTKDPVYYTLTVTHVDENGNELAPAETVTYTEGDAYVTGAVSVDGYVFETTGSDAASGIMDTDKAVVYVYVKEEAEEIEEPVIDILDEDVPLADVPKTGDTMLPWIFAALTSALGLIWLALSEKKRRAVNG